MPGPFEISDGNGDNGTVSMVFVGGGCEDQGAMKVALAQMGPMSTYMDAKSDDVRFYSEGNYLERIDNFEDEGTSVKIDTNKDKIGLELSVVSRF